MSEKAHKSIRLLLADDHPLVLAGTRKALKAETGIEIIGEAHDGKEALHLTLALKPDVLLLDVEMPKMSGVEVARNLFQKKSEVKVIAMSAFDDQEYVYGILNNGASGYLLKEETDSEILTKAIQAVSQGETDWISRKLAVKLLRSNTQSKNSLDILSPREIEVLQLAALGLKNKAIGERLFISPFTVKNHLDKIKQLKIGVQTRTELVVWAWQKGLVKQGDQI